MQAAIPAILKSAAPQGLSPWTEEADDSEVGASDGSTAGERPPLVP